MLRDTPLPWSHLAKAVIHGQSPTMHLLGHSSNSYPPQYWQTPNHRPSGVVCSGSSVKTEHCSSLGPCFSSARPPAKERNPAPSKELPAKDSSRLTSMGASPGNLLRPLLEKKMVISLEIELEISCLPISFCL